MSFRRAARRQGEISFDKARFLAPLEMYLPALEVITGIQQMWADLEKVSERIWNLTRMFWVRKNNGFGRDWHMPAPRFYTEAPKTETTAGQIPKPEDVNKMLDMYDEQRGWTSDGLLKQETLERLGLSEL